MYQIAICDDEQGELTKIKNLLLSYKDSYPDHEFTIHSFITVSSLLTAIKQDTKFDILLLDIYMPEKNGIDAAKELRENGFNGSIIFLTSSLEHAVDAFLVDALQYFIKPVDQSRFFSVIKKAIQQIPMKQAQYIPLRFDGCFRKIALQEIVCCESHGNYQYITLMDSSLIKVRMTLVELHKLMNDCPDFIRVGIAYLINLSHIDSLSAKEILLDNHQKIKVPRGAYSSLKKLYFEFYCER